MKFKDLYRTLERNNYRVFSFQDILFFYPGEKRSNLKRMICRWTKEGWIYSLKRGLYELTYPKDFIIPDTYIANKLYAPSYVSLETALSIYSIIPEVSMAVTSVTAKATRKFKNKHGLFIYRTVKADAFTGYYVEKRGTFDILMAEPEKAVIDYLYLKMRRGKKIDLKEQRFDKGVVMDLKKRKMDRYAKLYNIDLREFYVNL